MEKPVVIKINSSQIIGILHLPGEKIKKFPCVIFCHGFTGNKAENHFIFTRMARLLTECGIASLRFDFRGSGDSSNYFDQMSLFTQIQDVDCVYHYLIKKNFIDREKIGVLGLSMGAVAATYISSKYQLKSVVLWSPVAFPYEIEKKILTRKIKKNLEKKGKVYLSGSGFRIGKRFIDSLKKIIPLQDASSFKGDSLIIHSKDDSVIDVSHAISYHKAFHNCGKIKNLIIMEKGGHTFVLEETEEKVIEETKNFFLQTLSI